MLVNLGLYADFIGSDENLSVKPPPEINAFGQLTELSSPLLHMRSGLIKRKRTDTLDASDPDFSSATFTLQFEPPSAMSKKASLFKLGGLTTDGFISHIDESATDNDLASLALGLLLKQSPE